MGERTGLADTALGRVLARGLFSGLSRGLGLSRRADRIRALPDRKLLIEGYIPALGDEGGRVLWVGCRHYTADDYQALERRGAQVWTTDIDPGAARWGRKGRHRTGDVCQADILFADILFDAVVCNGVLGYGVDRPEQQAQAIQALARIVRPGGRLLLGWNTDKIADPLVSGVLGQAFRPTGFAGQFARVTFDTVTHVYDSLVRTEG